MVSDGTDLVIDLLDLVVDIFGFVVRHVAVHEYDNHGHKREEKEEDDEDVMGLDVFGRRFGLHFVV
jgi:hypothetical protein